MVSPDATPYIDPPLLDYDPQDIYDMAVEDTQTAMPEWQAREGQTEVLVYEGMAVQVAEAVYAINRLTSSTVRAMLALIGVTYDLGEQPTVNLKFNLSGTAGTTIPAGTSVRLDLPNNLEPIVFVTGNEVTVPSGSANVVIPATGDRYTADANGYPAGTDVVLLDSLIYVDSVELFDEVIDGRNPEADEDYFSRGSQTFGRMTLALVTEPQFEAVMDEEVYVHRSLAIDNYNPVSDPDNNGPVGNDPGHVTIAAYGDGANLSTADRDALIAKISPMMMSALALHFINPTIVTVNVSVSVTAEPGFAVADVQANVDAALRAYLSPATWDWSGTVRRNDLISLITNVTGVDFVQTLSTPASDLALTGVAPLANAGSITVTVVG